MAHTKEHTGLGQSRQGKTYPYPVGAEARAKAKKLHDAAGRKTKPWFYRASDNTFHRWDNKGKGKLGLIDAKRKLFREAIYKANQDKLTPKLADYEAVFGKDRGRAVFKAEQVKLRQIYSDYDPRIAQIDHLQSKRSGGLHISRNLNPQEAFANMSEGNRGVLPKNVSSQLMVDPGGDIRKTIAIQGPELTPLQKNLVMGRGVEGGKGIVPKEVNNNAKYSLRKYGRKLPTGKMVRGIGRTEALARIAAGDYVGGGLGLAMQTDAFHKQIGKALAARLGKSAAKLVPGVGMAMGTLEAAGYASQGRFTQAGIAAFGAAVGEIPWLGDILQGGADLVNTGIDIATGNLRPDYDIEEEDLLKAARKALR